MDFNAVYGRFHGRNPGSGSHPLMIACIWTDGIPHYGWSTSSSYTILNELCAHRL